MMNLDAMIEDRNAQEWEDQNREEPTDTTPAINRMADATYPLHEAIRCLHQAAKLIEGDPEEHRIEALAMDLESVSDDIDRLLTKMEGL